MEKQTVKSECGDIYPDGWIDDGGTGPYVDGGSVFVEGWGG